jgi:hypothetical protein
MTRRAFAGVLALVALGLSPARSAADPAPTPEAPVVVAGVPVTVKQATARAGAYSREPYFVNEELASVVHAR